jgi:protein-tyrosine phosphatase
MIDVHTHLLPGVDDGSPSVEVSVPVLERFAAEGVETVVCTPHLRASAAERAPHHEHAAILERLRGAAPAVPRLALGWEIMLDAPGVDLTDRRLTLAGSTAVLVEFPRMALPPRAIDELYRIRMSGVVPVVAHPERYRCTTAMVTEWRRVGAVMQLDAAALFARGPMGDRARELLAEGLYDLAASDTHGDPRSLAPARQWLIEAGASEAAELLMKTNAARLLADQPVLPVPAVRPPRSLADRLRAIFLPGR